MTRLRVHELAKELNIDNKGLIERIEKLGFSVKNHMSPLSESAVLKIRQEFSEARLGAEKVEEKRIGREVIRRRKKVDAQPEPEAPQAAAQDLPSQSAPEVFETPPVEVAPPMDIQADVAERAGEVHAAVAPPVAEAPDGVELLQTDTTDEEMETAQPAESVEEKDIPEKGKQPVQPERKFEAARIVKPAPPRVEPAPPPREELKPAAKAQPVSPPPPLIPVIVPEKPPVAALPQAATTT